MTTRCMRSASFPFVREMSTSNASRPERLAGSNIVRHGVYQGLEFVPVGCCTNRLKRVPITDSGVHRQDRPRALQYRIRRDRQDDRAFLHLFDEVAVRLISGGTRVHLIAVVHAIDQRIDVAQLNRRRSSSASVRRARRLARSSSPPGCAVMA